MKYFKSTNNVYIYGFHLKMFLKTIDTVSKTIISQITSSILGIAFIMILWCCGEFNSYKQLEAAGGTSRYNNCMDNEKIIEENMKEIEIELFGRPLNTTSLNDNKDKDIKMEDNDNLYHSYNHSNSLNIRTLNISNIDNLNCMKFKNNSNNNLNQLEPSNNNGSNNLVFNINNINNFVFDDNKSKINHTYGSCINNIENLCRNSTPITFEELFEVIITNKESIEWYCYNRDMSYAFSEKEFTKFLSYVILYFCSNEGNAISSAKKILFILNIYFERQNSSIRPFVVPYTVRINNNEYKLTIWQLFLWYYFLGSSPIREEFDIYRLNTELIFKNIVSRVHSKELSERILVQLNQSMRVYGNCNSTFGRAIIKFLQVYGCYLIRKYPGLVKNTINTVFK